MEVRLEEVLRRSLITPFLLSCFVLTSAGALADNALDPDTAHTLDFKAWELRPYRLDAQPRYVEENHKLVCAHDQMVRYRSKALRYAVTGHPDFVERLQRFEALVIELAIEHYGRAPRRLVHHGVFACRSLRTRSERISEHALGNAIDLNGLDFSELPRGTEAPAGMPRAMRRGFELRVLTHWSPRRARHAYHAEFLHRMVEELRARPDIFRGIVGPPHRRHLAHLHLDVAPWRYAMYAFKESS
jgi:hypothetical protein